MALAIAYMEVPKPEKGPSMASAVASKEIQKPESEKAPSMASAVASKEVQKPESEKGPSMASDVASKEVQKPESEKGPSMASDVASKEVQKAESEKGPSASAVVASKEVPKSIFLMDILGSPASVRHLFSTGGAPPRSTTDGVKGSTSGEDAAAADRRPERDLSIPKLFTGGALDLFPEAAMRDLMLALVEDGGAVPMTGFSPRAWWVSKEDGDAVQLKVAMPGLGKEHVKILAEKNVLVIKGEAGKDPEGDGDKAPAGYVYRIGLSSLAFKMDQIKADMMNGVLTLTVPKIKDEERKDVFEIKVE